MMPKEKHNYEVGKYSFDKYGNLIPFVECNSMQKLIDNTTKKIEEKAIKQYKLGSDLEKQNVVAKFFNPTGDGTWYLMNMKDRNYAWGIVNWVGLEIGSFSINELEEVKLPFGMGIERDLYFEEKPAIDIWNNLINIKYE